MKNILGSIMKLFDADSKYLGSGALPGLMLDLESLKIIWRGVFFPFLAPAEGSNPAGSYYNPLPYPAGQS